MMSSTLPEYVRRRARELGLSQTELATRAGISRQTLVKLLNGEVRDPRITTVIALAQSLQISPFYMLRVWLAGQQGGLRSAILDVRGDRCSYVGGEIVPNGLIVGAGQAVTMQCSIQNSGDEYWEGRRLICINPPDTGAQTPALRPVEVEIVVPGLAPGQVHEITISVIAPSVPGLYATYWKMIDKHGRFCFPDLPPIDLSVTVIGF